MEKTKTYLLSLEKTMTDEQKNEFNKLTSEQREQLEDFIRFAASGDFHGFSCCGHHHEEEPGILWNDAGHRLQVERAIWILAATDPGSIFHSYWAIPEFRTGLYQGLYDADYKDEYGNVMNLVNIFKGRIYTCHFYDAETGTNIVSGNDTLRQLAILGMIDKPDKTAKDMIVEFHKKAALENRMDMYRCGLSLGLATHFFTDLTQPMHGANFANYVGFYRSHNIVDPWDERHMEFENAADDIINNPGHNVHNSLFANAATTGIRFEDSLNTLIDNTAKNAKRIFNQKVKDILDVRPVNPNACIPAFQESFPAGQVATAAFFRQWARASGGYPEIYQRSDSVSVSERFGQPCMFYLQDGGNNRLVFRYSNSGSWQEDFETFKKFDGLNMNSPIIFAACYEPKTKHPAIFVSNSAGKLHYFHTPNGAWHEIEIKLTEYGSYIRGPIASVYDERYETPCAFFKGINGSLVYVYGNGGNGFKVSVIPGTSVGGAISAVWDPEDCGMGDKKGHMAVSYVAGDGKIHHMQVRNGIWQRRILKSPEGAQADPLIVTSVYDATNETVGVFWGMIKYSELRQVPGSDPAKYYRQQLPAKLQYSRVINTNSSPQDLGIEVAGGISATSQPRIAVHYNNFATGFLGKAELVNGSWVKEEFKHTDRISGNVSAVNAVNGSYFVGGKYFKGRDTWIIEKRAS